jgi:hypothetical protein
MAVLTSHPYLQNFRDTTRHFGKFYANLVKICIELSDLGSQNDIKYRDC